MSRSWLKLSVVVDGRREEEAADLFSVLGAEAVSTRGNDDAQWLKAGLSEEPQWASVEVTGLFADGVDVAAIAKLVSKRLDAPTATMKLADRDWVREWREDNKPFRVGRDLWICPSFETPSVAQATRLWLDPGLAFGSGSHPTTAMCLDWISRVSNPDEAPGSRPWSTMLDYGCGSGVLAIAALLLGYESAVAVDIDPQALRASRENAAKNGVSDRIVIQHPDQLDSQYQADVVIANILAATIEELGAELLRRLRPGGALVMSGILSHQADALIHIFGADRGYIRWQREQWILLTTRK